VPDPFDKLIKTSSFFQGWTKPNAFHVCITSYKLVLQDHQAFRRKSWRYLILDEAQNIKNFKSQRWQSLLNFNRSALREEGGDGCRCPV
jgi:SNF2 family DNA or RNA helicase